MEIIILPNQSFLDIAIQHTGNIENAFMIALGNNMAIANHLEVGMKITIPSAVKTNKQVFSNYVIKKIEPASARISDLNIKPLSGINYWELEYDFIVQ
ncbi:hypothetical protein DBR39_13800 [Chryseobacterium sp. KBW03]|uniref:hypothetical protein n=1 Tax=Chryseobacterium sp. KBW03 TaxID=2153362 RepID=UPI000F59F2FC|nr:hypothetical protein [Chryseobacterium sp. KBW03]RQO37956.1 hypothetical protein DBR39_13800 [Chryseobacterium sp. KBW03]